VSTEKVVILTRKIQYVLSKKGVIFSLIDKKGRKSAVFQILRGTVTLGEAA